jgi:D-alanyl-D-alanine carboxypeptidase (penicillin-binding protein 5/6)
MIARLLKTALFAGALALSSAPAQAEFETRATSAFIIDMGTGTVLLEKNADIPLPPASMSKLMTLNMLFEAIEDGRVSMDTTFTVSERARAMGGSRMFLELRDRPTAEELIRGIAVLSGNDAAVVVAEGLAGTEDAFARLATERARALGMENTTIANASGWPDPNHLMSKRDLAILARHIIDDFPQFYPYLSEEAFTWNDITQRNRVPLLDAGLGLDGLKTGFTSAAGYSLVGSARQGNRRVLFTIGGLTSERERAEEAERIINWAFRQFVQREVLRQGQAVATADVWMGSAAQVGLVAAHDVDVLLPATRQDEMTAEVIYTGPLPAPVAAGQQVAELVITVPEMGEHRVPLLAAQAVPVGGFVVRMRSAIDAVLRQVAGASAGQ